MTIQDQQQRSAALNPTQSFIVQAPAGSGKTELLTQRFLVLLSHVKQPEEILAITFTKKSAAEMRDRIIKALKNALTDIEPESTHAKTTWRLAKKVLQQDKEHHWNLLASPSRLRIQTIDSFNANLTKQLPILSRFGAPPDITDDTAPLYQQAAREFLSHLEDDADWSNAIATILLHMDNNLDDVEKLLINLLKNRDQWLPHITKNLSDPSLRKKLESHLAYVVTCTLEAVNRHAPENLISELLFLARYAAENIRNENAESSIACLLDLTTLPGTTADDKKYWLGISELLITQEENPKKRHWRKKIDKNTGFPAPADFKNKEEKNLAKMMKERMQQLLAEMSSQENFFYALLDIQLSPDPTYQETQWETLAALHHVLHVIVAQLTLTFQQHSKIDYTENSLAALTALGTEEAPTDLALALDYQIKHILIDEFQDTSYSQFRLLEKMTAGWETNDGRTLFLVGDPMQSIYRFREAEVGLFIRARKHGIGSIHLESLTLSVNFRSHSAIVNWVNRCFTRVFPAFDEIATGAVSYASSQPHQTNDNPDSCARLHTHFNADQQTQAETIVQLIQQRKKTHPAEKIAILVRSRTHLADIIPALKKAALTYRAIEIDALTERPFIQDLMALTRALLHPADRIAWLAVLRAPWCGLSLSDLLILSGNDSRIHLWERLQNNEVIASLSTDGQTRLQRTLPILQNKLNERRRFSLRYWIESTWLLLGGPACLAQETDLADAAAYFNLLEKLDHGGDLLNLDALPHYVEKLYATPNNQADDTLQIMTIHNAKGLEFDTVILPHLERKAPNDEKQLLRWMEIPRENEDSALVLAPIHATGQENDTIYEYIKKQHASKNDYEKSRLLYVAATRAKKQLHLLFNLKQTNGEPKPLASSLLEKLWPAIKTEALAYAPQQINLDTEETTDEEKMTLQPFIQRLPAHWHNPIKEKGLADTIAYHQKNSGFLLPDNHPKYIGVLIHQILQQMAKWGCDWWQTKSTALKTAYLKNNLTQLGMMTADIPHTIEKINSAIEKTIADPRGQWILFPHQDAQAELQLTAFIEQEPKQLIIDRTFIDEKNTRWIIDYKTSSCTDDDLEKFLAAEQKKYHPQMQQYFHAMKAVEQRPIRLGLYFPLLQAWREWEPTLTHANVTH